MKTHENKEGRVVAVCDTDLVGKVYEEGAKILDLKAYANFYKGSEVGESEVLEALKSFSSLNFVGRNAVALAIKAKLAGKAQVREIAKVPHIHVYRI